MVKCIWTWNYKQLSKTKTDILACSITYAIKLNNKDKAINDHASMEYKRPATLQNKLTNYKFIAHDHLNQTAKGSCKLCYKCALCRNHGNINLWLKKSDITTPNGQIFKFNQNLACPIMSSFVCGTNWLISSLRIGPFIEALGSWL